MNVEGQCQRCLVLPGEAHMPRCPNRPSVQQLHAARLETAFGLILFGLGIVLGLQL